MASDFYKKLGGRIRELRQKQMFSRGQKQMFSREKLSELADMNTYYLGEIERGEKKPSLDFLIKICNVLKIKLHELLNLE